MQHTTTKHLSGNTAKHLYGRLLLPCALVSSSAHGCPQGETGISRLNRWLPCFEANNENYWVIIRWIKLTFFCITLTLPCYFSWHFFPKNQLAWNKQSIFIAGWPTTIATCTPLHLPMVVNIQCVLNVVCYELSVFKCDLLWTELFWTDTQESMS